jgi:thiol-disulfide isomerase/thioredoxin
LKNTPKRNQKHVVDSLIRTNNQSFTNLYLIDKYYVNEKNPNYKHLKELIESQSGIIKDTPYMMLLQPKIEDLTDKSTPQSVHSLIGEDRQGKDIKWSEIRDKYILIDFWASWNSKSVVEQDSLVPVIKALKKEKFLICSVSLDVDKAAWLKSSDRDTTQWKQICDFKGWNNSIVKNQNIESLPSNLLLDRNKRIIARDIRGQKLIDKVKELIKKDKEREKQKKSSKKKK